MRDASLTVPSGTEGIVMDVKVFSRKEKARTESDKLEERRRMREINSEFRNKLGNINQTRKERVKKLLLDNKLTADMVNSKSGEVVVASGRKISEAIIEKLEEMYKEAQP